MCVNIISNSVACTDATTVLTCLAYDPSGFGSPPRKPRVGLRWSGDGAAHWLATQSRPLAASKMTPAAAAQRRVEFTNGREQNLVRTEQLSSGILFTSAAEACDLEVMPALPSRSEFSQAQLKQTKQLFYATGMEAAKQAFTSRRSRMHWQRPAWRV